MIERIETLRAESFPEVCTLSSRCEARVKHLIKFRDFEMSAVTWQ